MIENKDKKDIDESLEDIADDHFEDSELEEIESNDEQKIKELREKLKNCEKEKMEHLENLQRAKAEFLNARKRLDEEKIVDRERATQMHIEKLLPLCDSFTLAMSNKGMWENVDPTWKKGIESIQSQLDSLLSSYSVKVIHPVGEQFSPVFHEALLHVPTQNEEDEGKVLAVIQNGYVRTIGGKETIVRPARVSVGEYKKEG